MIKAKLYRRKGLTPAIQVTGTDENIEALKEFTGLTVDNYPDSKLISIQSEKVCYAGYSDYILKIDGVFCGRTKEQFEELFVVEV